MAWKYKPPQNFPAHFLAVLREAALYPNETVALGSDSRYRPVQALAEKFRHFRWCIREKPTAMNDLSLILDTFDIRTAITNDEVGFILSVIAKPTKLSEFVRLNPELASEILPGCQ